MGHCIVPQKLVHHAVTASPLSCCMSRGIMPCPDICPEQCATLIFPSNPAQVSGLAALSKYTAKFTVAGP